jgi:hypothetical protein
MALTGAGLNAMRSIPTFGTIGAIAEIVDNSIQWKTDNDVEINIIFIQKDGGIEDVLIVDNGKGMGLDSKNREIIEYCLMFGGGTNHEANSGLGKYGIGLPYGCCSQSTNYHIYSWQEKNKIKHKMRNHNDFGPEEPVIDKPFEIIDSFPKYFSNYLPELASYSSGTIVHWKDCDKLTYKRALTLINHLEHKLGRIYRHFIGEGVSINFKAFNQPNNNYPIPVDGLCKEIRKFDPLFLETGSIAPQPHNSVPSSEQFGEEEIIHFEDSKGIVHEIKIKASLAKKDIQLPNCGPGGNTEIGKLYGKVQGISLVRGNRELKLSHFDFPFPNGSSDPRHRWWKVEVLFEAISDQILDVNANKTDAQHFRYISDDDSQDQNIDYIKLRYILSAKVNNLIGLMWKEINLRVSDCKEKKNNKAQTCPHCKENTLVNGRCKNEECGEIVVTCQAEGHENIVLIEGLCPSCENVSTSNICSIHKQQFNENGKCKECEEQATINLTEDEEEELINFLEGYREFNGDKVSIKSLIDWFIKSNKKHFVIFVSNPTNPNQLFEIKNEPGKFDIILVNKNHPFYETHIGPLRNLVNSGITFNNEEDYDLDQALESLILFIITWASTEVASTTDKIYIQRFRIRFGLNLNENLGIWNE